MDSKTEIWLTAKEVAALCGIAERTIRDWANSGTLARRGENEYDAIAAVAKRLSELRERQSDTPVKNLQIRKLAAQTEKLEAEARLLELELAAKKGELIEAISVEQEWQELIARTKTRMLGIPAAIAPALASETNATEVQNLLTKEIRRALSALSNDLAA